MELQIDTAGSFPIAQASGEIRSEDAQIFMDELHPLVAESGAKLAVDLSNVSFLDSTGLTSLINLVTRARLTGARAVLVAPTRFVAGVFEVTNLDRWFEIVKSLDDAIQSLERDRS